MLTSNGYVLDESPARLAELETTPKRQHTDRDALWERLRRDGYLLLRGALDRDTVMDFRRYYFSETAPVDGYVEPADPVLGLAPEPPDGPPLESSGPTSEVARPGGVFDREKLHHVLFSTIVPGPEYAAFCTQPAVRGFFEWFLGGETFLHKRKIIRCTRPAEMGVGAATQAHYDLVYLREGTDRVLSCWIPIGDTPIERGGLTYLSGSHHRVLAEERDGTLPRPARSITADLPSLADKYDTQWMITDYAAGDMVVHSAYIMHAALDNVATDRVMRLSTDIRYQRADQPIDWRWQNHWHINDGL